MCVRSRRRQCIVFRRQCLHYLFKRKTIVIIYIEHPSHHIHLVVCVDIQMPHEHILRHGDAANVSNEARGIFLERRRHSSLERLFRNSCLYLECFITGKSPVAVTVTSSDLNVNEDGVIRFVVIFRIKYSSKVL